MVGAALVVGSIARVPGAICVPGAPGSPDPEPPGFGFGAGSGPKSGGVLSRSRGGSAACETSPVKLASAAAAATTRM